MAATKAKTAERIEDLLNALLTLNHWQGHLLRTALLLEAGKRRHASAKPQRRKTPRLCPARGKVAGVQRR